MMFDAFRNKSNRVFKSVRFGVARAVGGGIYQVKEAEFFLRIGFVF